MSNQDDAIVQAGEQVRVPARTATGAKTTVSMPATEYARYVEQSGGGKEFRRHLNTAVKEVQPRPGYSRSMLVRMQLDASIKQS